MSNPTLTRLTPVTSCTSWLLLTTLSVISLLAPGCAQEVESTDVRTSGVYPEIDVTATGNGSSRVVVRLKVGGRNSNTYLDLTGPDTLQASTGGTTKTLDSSDSHSYAAVFPTDAQAEFTVAFLRGPADTNAPASRVTLPVPFDAALDTTQASRATSDVTVTWTPPAAGDLSLTVNGGCFIGYAEQTPDDGTAIVSRDRLQTYNGRANDSCTADVTLERDGMGEVDPAFTEGGSVLARQIRGASFTTTP
jgi:hypothetical protein